MSKISARDVQMFVGGVLAFIGFQALRQLPYIISGINGGAVILVTVFTLAYAIALPIGVGVLLRRERAIRWAYIYIWVLALIVFGGFAVKLIRSAEMSTFSWWWESVADLVVPEQPRE